jgi:hypothetical protein
MRLRGKELYGVQRGGGGGGIFREVLDRHRRLNAHEANLYDADAKYGDLVSVEETFEYLEEVDAARVR